MYSQEFNAKSLNLVLLTLSMKAVTIERVRRCIKITVIIRDCNVDIHRRSQSHYVQDSAK
jgi:hypothetical protein